MQDVPTALGCLPVLVNKPLLLRPTHFGYRTQRNLTVTELDSLAAGWHTQCPYMLCSLLEETITNVLT